MSICLSRRSQMKGTASGVCTPKRRVCVLWNSVGYCRVCFFFVGLMAFCEMLLMGNWLFFLVFFTEVSNSVSLNRFFCCCWWNNKGCVRGQKGLFSSQFWVSAGLIVAFNSQLSSARRHTHTCIHIHKCTLLSFVTRATEWSWWCRKISTMEAPLHIYIYIYICVCDVHCGRTSVWSNPRGLSRF